MAEISEERQPEHQESEERQPETQSEERQPGKQKSAAREIVETLALALLFALVIRTFVVEVYQVSGHSMTNTLYDHERVLVNKFVYRIRDPQPGDVIVFKYPRQPDRDFIKRVVAVAGDTVELQDGQVLVNGIPFEEAATVRLSSSDFGPYVVPDGAVFVLGDNRSNSEDSRYFGEVPRRNIRGLAFARIWPLNRIGSLKGPDQGDLAQGR